MLPGIKVVNLGAGGPRRYHEVTTSFLSLSRGLLADGTIPKSAFEGYDVIAFPPPSSSKTRTIIEDLQSSDEEYLEKARGVHSFIFGTVNADGSPDIKGGQRRMHEFHPSNGGKWSSNRKPKGCGASAKKVIEYEEAADSDLFYVVPMEDGEFELRGKCHLTNKKPRPGFVQVSSVCDMCSLNQP